jgi:hypothetical protein
LIGSARSIESPLERRRAAPGNKSRIDHDGLPGRPGDRHERRSQRLGWQIIGVFVACLAIGRCNNGQAGKAGTPEIQAIHRRSPCGMIAAPPGSTTRDRSTPLALHAMTILLVPQGARLIGKYDSVVAFGQRRALVIWQRLILPDGSSVRLDNMPATDTAGYAGLADRVDFHTWTLLKGVAIATMLGVGSELSISGGSDLVQAIRQSAQMNVARAGDQITQRNLDVQPTVTIRPGAPVRLLVTHDLILAPYPERTS